MNQPMKVIGSDDGEERDELWKLMVEELPQYEEYLSRTERIIPIVALDPR